MTDDPKGRKVLQDGGAGGGYLACDEAEHWWVVPEYAKFGCETETHVGPCLCPKPQKATSREGP